MPSRSTEFLFDLTFRLLSVVLHQWVTEGRHHRCMDFVANMVLARHCTHAFCWDTFVFGILPVPRSGVLYSLETSLDA